MRAVLLERKFTIDDIGKDLLLEGDSARHLIKVIRIKKFEKVLILNGLGSKCEVEIKHIDRKSLTFNVITVEEVVDERKLSLFLGLPKKEAFESIVKMAAEIGIKNLYLFRSEYSQQTIEIGERVERLEESAIVQSNNPFKINFLEVSSFEEVFEKYLNIVHFSTFSATNSNSKVFEGEVLMIIGPEAGFSGEEEKTINGYANVTTINLDTNIMRAPTAFAVASGYILKSF
ncbi:RsmE family RNA methyltransferase [Halobacteriovorax sp. JY17]|uniref:RsmE family RNA methyltransferase n=1 Tax=Halobacteriovorax sp. JY17 TaxID=2014617 RepID=UPI000C5FEBCA|nr:RsmE family RNA methyltransferase [Halobacteriovorax sp. JY17]PIK14430.1 MAG: hypothetical protein CES88_08795 [Halobacteriovorax sp. JY17]